MCGVFPETIEADGHKFKWAPWPLPDKFASASVPAQEGNVHEIGIRVAVVGPDLHAKHKGLPVGGVQVFQQLFLNGAKTFGGV